MLLERARRGDRRVADELMPLIYEELRRLAHHHLRQEGPGHTLQATALVNETYLRLVGSDCTWQNRAHFFAVAATTIRRVLVQHARRKASLKRGGGRARIDVDPALLQQEGDDVDERVLAVDEALNCLAELDADKARLVELRFFAGLTVEEAAVALGISPRSAAREWQVARAWLSRALSEEGGT
jgi:RNA polymerase sigma factor (TIGR02999 family)